MSTTVKTLDPEYCYVNYTSNYQLLSSYTSYLNLLGTFEDQIKISIDYFNAITSNDPVTNLVAFYKNLDSSKFNLLDNEFIDFWIKKFHTSITTIQEQVLKDKNYNSFFNDISDSIGILFNSNNLLDDSTLPFIDLYYETMYKTAPNTIPVNVKNKLSSRVVNILNDASLKTSILMRQNLKNIFYTSPGKPPFTDSLMPHGSNLVTDTNFYNIINNNLISLVPPIINRYQNLFKYISFYSNINNNSGYNPQSADTNKQLVKNLMFSLDTEGTKVQVDLLLKKVKNILRDATINYVLANTKTQISSTDTQSTNLNNNVTSKKAVIPADQTPEYTKSKTSSEEEIKKPSEEKKSQPQIIDYTTLSNNPDAIAKDAIGKSIGPSVLPSVDPGFFGQLAQQAQGFSPSTDPMSIYSQVQQTKELVCNFTKPSFTEPNFEFLLNQSIDNIEEYFNSISDPSLPDPGELAKQIAEEFVKQVKQQMKSLYDSLFTCGDEEESV